MSDSDDDVPLAKRAPVVKKEVTVKTEADGQAEKGKGPAVKAEKTSPDGTARKGAKGASAAMDNMPGIPKDEPSESTKTPAAKAAKGNKAAIGKRTSTEKASKPKTKAAKEAAANGKADKAAGAAKKERKVFDMPGQTRDTPPEEDPLRKFYMSLREQRPDSAIAAKWLMQVGLLPRDEAEVEAAKLKNARSPVKAPRGGSTSGVKRKRLAANENKASRKRANPAENGIKKKPAKKKTKKDESENEDDDSDSDFDDEAPLAKRKRPAPKKTPASAPAKRPPPKGKKDVAFTDGGLDGEDSSDDDLPLAQRAVKMNS